jgi:hypothetical protein
MIPKNLKNLNRFISLSLLGFSRVFGLNPISHNVVMGYMGAIAQITLNDSTLNVKQNLKYNKTLKYK